jgi:flagellar protein FliO/FliZ
LPARSLCTALVVWILFFSVTNLSAQEDSAGDNQAEQAIQTSNPIETQVPVEDPNIAAQQSLAFGSPDAAAIPAASGVSVFGIFRVILTLAVIAAAIYGLVYFLKFRRASREKEGQDPFLKILASVPLGASRGVHVISVGPQAWLVGSAESGVNLISEISDKDTINAMLLEDSKRLAAPAVAGAALLDFRAILGKLGISTKPENSGPDQIRKRRERLKEL